MSLIRLGIYNITFFYMQRNSPNICKFIEFLASGKDEHGQSLEKLVNDNPEKAQDYILRNHQVLTEKYGTGTCMIFDIIYEQAIHAPPPLHAQQQLWQDILIRIVRTIDSSDEEDVKIAENRRYILHLQGNNNNYVELFRAMLLRGFDMGDPEFLVYSLIARGELDKLKLLARYYKIEDYPAIFDVALRYGRLQVLEYFIKDCGVEPAYYGNIMDFENFMDNARYLYYRAVGNVAASNETPAILNSRQDYLKSIRLIMETYPHPVNTGTLNAWCDMLRNKYYLWDRAACSGEIIQLVKSYVTETIPLTADFREFNRDVFDAEWSDRAQIVEKCLALREHLNETQERYEHVLERLHLLLNNERYPITFR